MMFVHVCLQRHLICYSERSFFGFVLLGDTKGYFSWCIFMLPYDRLKKINHMKSEMCWSLLKDIR